VRSSLSASALLAVLLAAPSAAQTLEAAPERTATAKLEVFMNKLTATKNGIGVLTASVAVAPNHSFVIEDPERFYQVAWGVVRKEDGLKGLSAFDYATDGLFVGVRGKELVYLSKTGKLVTMAPLPSAGMGLAVGSGKLYLFERNETGVSRLFVLYPGKKLVKICDSPKPIDAVMEEGDRVLYSAGGSIMGWAPDGRTGVAFVHPKNRRIVSMAQDPKSLKVYISDGLSVISIKGDQVVTVTREAGGILRWYGDGLVVFDPLAKLLMRIRNLP
jgi:hypothetical protein